MHEILSGKDRIPLGTGSGKHGFYCNPISQCIRFIAYASIVFCVYFGGGGLGKSTFCEAAATGDNYVHDIKSSTLDDIEEII